MMGWAEMLHDRVQTAREQEMKYLSARKYLDALCVFFWAAMPTASNGINDSVEYLKDVEECDLPIMDQSIGPVLLSSYGLKALINNGQLTVEEGEDLMNSGLPPSQYAYILLVWVGLHCMEGMENKVLRGGFGFEENLLRQLTTLRASMFDIDDFRGT